MSDAATRVYKSPVRDTLADIDKTKPLSIAHIKRIVRAARAAGLLAMDHPEELRCSRDLHRETPYMSPHGAVDAFLAPTFRDSCPCNFRAQSHGFPRACKQFAPPYTLLARDRSRCPEDSRGKGI
jgi:hypothetical protein